MTMTLDEVPGVSRQRSRKKRRSRKSRRAIKVIGWSLVGLATTAIFMTGAIYFVLSMRGEATGVPNTGPMRPEMPY